jgi:hypothetical protein
MNQTVVYADFSAINQAPALDGEILREVVVETIDCFGQVQFAHSLTEIPQEALRAA